MWARHGESEGLASRVFKWWVIVPWRYSRAKAVHSCLATVQTGDVNRIDVTGKRIGVRSEEETQRSLASWGPPEPRVKRGYLARYARQVVPALQGGDLS